MRYCESNTCPPPEIPDAVPIDRRLIVDTIAVQVDKDETQAPNSGGEAPTLIVPNPDQIIQPHVPLLTR